MSENKSGRCDCQGLRPAAVTSLQQFTCWDPVFDTRRNLDTSVQTPFVDILADVKDAEPAATASDLSGETFVRNFMKDPLDQDTCLPRADRVEAVCFGPSVRQLLEEKGLGNQKPVALLDERSFKGNELGPGGIRGPFTARGLYQALKAQATRVHREESPAPSARAEPTATSLTAAIGTESGHETGRHLIFITDLDRWSIYALVGTASKYQAYALRVALYRHVALEAFVGVTFATDTLRMFNLSFSLPYYALRRSVKPVDDPRREGPNSTALRHCQDITFLDWQRGPGSKSCYLYESQISCMITGFDSWRWTGYCFADTYFDGQDSSDTVESYVDDAHEDEGLEVDPFTLGNQEAAKNFDDPRRYFLEVLRIRSNQIKSEWENVVSVVELSIRHYRQQTPECPLAHSSELPAEEIQQCEERVRLSRDWVVRVRRLSRTLLSQLSKTTEACEDFLTRYRHYFTGSDPSERSDDALSNIQATFAELENVRRKLNTLATQCDDFARELELKLIIDNIDINNATHNISRMMKLQQLNILLVITPIALSTQILALDPSFLPFVPQRFASLLVVIMLFFLATVISLYLFQMDQSVRAKCLRFVLTLLGEKRRSKENGSLLDGLRFLRRPTTATTGTTESYGMTSMAREENNLHDRNS